MNPNHFDTFNTTAVYFDSGGLANNLAEKFRKNKRQGRLSGAACILNFCWLRSVRELQCCSKSNHNHKGRLWNSCIVGHFVIKADIRWAEVEFQN